MMGNELNLKQFIYRKDTLGNIPKSEEDKEVFNIAFGIDAYFVPQMGIMITSILPIAGYTFTHF